MPRSRRSNAGSSAEDAAKQVLNEIKPGLEEHALRIRRFDRNYEVYRGSVAAGRDTRAWQSKIRVKHGMQIINDNVVSVIQGIPAVKVTPRSPQSVDAAKAMEHTLGYYSDLDHLAEKQHVVAQQALVYGVSPAKNHWLYREADRKQLVPGSDGEWTPMTTKVVECDRPSFQPWDAYACWWDPTARDPDTAAYIVLESWLTKDELERGRYNEDTKQGAYRNLDELYRLGQGQQPPSTAQNRLLADEGARYKGRFRIWEVWRNDRLTVIGNQQIVLRDGPKPFWLPGKPIVVGTTRPDFFHMEGVPETELVDHIQQALWTAHNLRFDQWKMTVLRGATVRETVPDMAQLVFRPSFLWPVTDHDDVKFQDPPPLPPEAYQEEQLLIDRLEKVTGISGYVTGTVGESAARSATGVSILSQAANKPLQFKAEQLRLHVWQRTYEQWADLTKQFLTREQYVRIANPQPDEPEWQRYGPQDIFGDYDVRIEASEESLDKQQKRADTVALLNALAPFAHLGLVNLEPLLEQTGSVFGFTNPKALIAPRQPGPQAAAPQQSQQLPAGPLPDLLRNGTIAQQPPSAVLAGNRS